MSTSSAACVAIIGSGMAGATCARLLTDAGLAVRLFDKSRGPGGRMATRRVEWHAADGALHTAVFDHGTPAFTARSPDFLRFVEQAHRDGLVARWAPSIAPRSYVPLGDSALWVPAPDMPSLCRALLATLPLTLACTVEALHQSPRGWRVASAGVDVAEGFSDVVLAIPPRQAAPLLLPHSQDGAERVQALPMWPGWTLMGVTGDEHSPHDAWGVAWPTEGPLSWIVRNDRKPGREHTPGLSHWVAHATVPWSQTHLESPDAEVRSLLQQALVQWVGRPLQWHHSAVHRWRYASVPRADAAASKATSSRCWWDASLGLGVCGDALGGGGVEGAWTSGRALAAHIIERHRSA